MAPWGQIASAATSRARSTTWLSAEPPRATAAGQRLHVKRLLSECARIHTIVEASSAKRTKYASPRHEIELLLKPQVERDVDVYC